jgi:hypothetical protein
MASMLSSRPARNMLRVATLGFAVDRSFVAVVPLGGRHVNHFWRLRSGIRCGIAPFDVEGVSDMQFRYPQRPGLVRAEGLPPCNESSVNRPEADDSALELRYSLDR